MIHFYIVTNTNKNEPEVVKQALYVHVKGKADGSQTAIVSEEKIESLDVHEVTQEQMQALLNVWIDEENVNPIMDLNDQPIVQSYIDVGSCLCN